MGTIINPAQQVHGEEELNAARRVIESGVWAGSKECDLFERELGEYIGCHFVTAVNSGSSANLAAILALTTESIPEHRRLFQGDEIITTALCFPTTVSPIVYAGCVPVFVDVERGTWNISPIQIEEMITDKTKAVIVAHNLGNPFNVDAVREVCEKYGLWLIEDNCDALGSEWDGKKTGSLGDIGTSSFYPAHHISSGEGGAVYTNNPKIAKGVRSIVNWGRDCVCRPGQDNACGRRYAQQFGDLPYGYDHKNTYSEFGLNLKMTDIQAAILREQLKRVDGFTMARRFNHDFLNQVLSGNDYFEQTAIYEGANPSWFGYVIKVKEDSPFTARELSLYLDSMGIRSRAFFCGNITRQPLLHGRSRVQWRKHSDLSVSDDVMESAFWIGVHPGITEEQREYIRTVLVNFFEKYE